VNPYLGNNPEDKQLIEQVLRGNHRAFATLIGNTEHLVAQIVFKMIPVAEDRKDLAQDIYLKVFRNLAGFKFQSKFSTWVARIAFNTCLTWIDKKKPVYPGNLTEKETIPATSEALYNTPVNASSSETRIFNKETAFIVGKEIEKLPPVYKTLIILFHQESMTYEELSQITGLAEGTVKSSLFRARKMLKENLLMKYEKEAL
jgi:RNA polymerase sigma factor (sigma-70 family)